MLEEKRLNCLPANLVLLILENFDFIAKSKNTYLLSINEF